MNPEGEQRGRYQPDYTGMTVQELVYCEMEDFRGHQRAYHLDVIRREGAAGPERVAIFVHGGGFLEPNDKRQAYISRFAKDLTAAGFAVISPDYPQFDSEAQLTEAGGERAAYARAGEAVHRCCQFLTENAASLGLRGDSFVLLGGSAGAMAAFYAIGNYRDRYDCFVNLWGPPDPLPEMRNFPPTLSVHGDRDPLVPYEREEMVECKLSACGVPFRLLTLSGEGHTPLGRYREFMPEVLAWMKWT